VISKSVVGKVRRVVAAAVGACLLSACVEHGKMVKPDAPVDLNTKGVMIVSVTRTQDASNSDGWYYYHPVGDDRLDRLDAIGAMISLIEPDDFPDDDDQKGRIFAVEMNPGEYRIAQWEMFVSRGAYAYEYIEPKSPVSLPFTIKPGEFVYLGNWHVEALVGKGFLGFKAVGGAHGEIHDRHERDLAAFRKKYPQFQDASVDVRVIDSTPWKEQYARDAAAAAKE
jgi:hypothetical protein